MTYSVEVTGALPQPTVSYVQPYGSPFYKLQCLRYELIEEHVDGDSEEETEELADDQIILDLKYIKSLDSKDWKDQDHYRVLGIPDLRVKASVKDVKKAYKFMVLKCHPDKSKGNTKIDEEAFTCIQKAYEQLFTIEGKRAYDSIDPIFDNDVPNITEHNKQQFYKVFGPLFELNAQWSMVKNVPRLGCENDGIDKVNDFYNFWYDFKSWREYSYLDEEERDKAECKEERRYIDKLNKTERVRRKKEEVARIHELVNNCYACDPRIKAFNDERKKRKQEAKIAKQEAYRKEQEALKLQKEEEVRLRKEEEEKRVQIAKEKADAEKKERQKLSKLLKNERKQLRDNVKNSNYFCSDNGNLVKSMENLELLVLNLSLDDMKKINSSSNDKDTFSSKYKNSLNSYLEEQEKKTKDNLIKAKQSQEIHKEQNQNSDKFSTADIALLVKAVKIYPPGTINRWATIASYMNQHSTVTKSYESKDIIQKVKQLQSKEGDDLRNKVNQQAYENFEKSQKTRIDEVKSSGGISSRDIGDSLTNDPPVSSETPKKKKEPWNSDEQKLLEEALKKYPQSVGAERWDKISSHVGTRNKKECMRRYKELVDLIKAKKAKQ